jgi:hypothetical protein
MKPSWRDESDMKTMSKIYVAILILTAAILPSPAFSGPQTPNFSTSSSTLSVPFVKVDGILLFKNLDLFFNAATGGLEIRVLDEVLPNDMIKIDGTISLAAGSFVSGPFQGFLNGPILITTQRQSGNLGYGINILDSDGLLQTSMARYTRWRSPSMAGSCLS